MKRIRLKEPHARYDFEEKAFICLICEEAGFEKWVFEPWEIPRHLKQSHKINRKHQNIPDWNEEFEKEYLKNRGKPLVYDDKRVHVDTTSPEKYEEERKRRLLEAKARKEALS